MKFIFEQWELESNIYNLILRKLKFQNLGEVSFVKYPF